MALSSPNLPRGIFPVSTIHLAIVAHSRDNQREQWVRTAEHHQSEAINLFTSLMMKDTQCQQTESFALSSLLIGFAFAFPLAVVGPTDDVSESLGK